MRKLIFILSLFVTANLSAQIYFPALLPVEPAGITGTFQIQGIGNSLMEGYTTDDRPNKNFLKKAYNKLQIDYSANFTSYENYGVAGADRSAIASQLTTAIADMNGADHHILVIEGGGNDIGASGRTALQTYGYYKDIVEDAVAAGYLVLFVNISAHNYSGYSPSTTNPIIDDYNQMIRDGIDDTSFPAFALLDLGADVHMGDYEPSGMNTTYFDATDQLHWTIEGHRYVGEDLLYPIIISIATGPLP